MKRLTLLLPILLFLIFSPLMGDYYSYKKGSSWQDFYGYHGWKSVYRYEGWKSVYKYESWQNVYGYYGWKEVYLKKGRDFPYRTRAFQRGTAFPQFLFFRGFVFCIR